MRNRLLGGLQSTSGCTDEQNLEEFMEDTMSTKRKEYPALKVDDRLSVPLNAKTWSPPKELKYDTDTYRSFKIDHFKTPADFLTYKAIAAEAEAKRLRAEAKDWKENGAAKEAEAKMSSLVAKLTDEEKAALLAKLAD